MQTNFLILTVLAMALVGYVVARRTAYANVTFGTRQHSLPTHYGYMVALWCALPVLALLILWKLAEPSLINSITADTIPAEVREQGSQSVALYINDVKNILASDRLDEVQDAAKREAAFKMRGLEQFSRNLLTVLALALLLACLLYSLRFVNPATKARVWVERFVKVTLIVCASIAILTTLGIVLSVLFESLRFFQQVGFIEFITGTKWSPQTAIRVDQVGSSGSFGAIPLFTGTLLISAIAMLVAVPLGLMSAIYLSEYASYRVRSVVKPLLEILAGIPTVVYGFFAALTVAPAIRDAGEWMNLSVSSESALAAGLVMGIMIIPFVSSLSDDVITAVPQSMRDGSFGLGATHAETIRKVVIPAALPGIVGSVLLAISRAIGETMIVMMAAGLAANLTANPLEAVTTVTVQIVTLLTGDQEFDSAKTLAAFALGLMLFITTLCLNVVALYTVRRYREQYE